MCVCTAQFTRGGSVTMASHEQLHPRKTTTTTATATTTTINTTAVHARYDRI